MNHVITLQDRINDMTDKEVAALKALHAWLAEVKESPRSEKYDPVQTIEDIEYTMQALWGFSRDRDFHIHWTDLKGCTCPKGANKIDLFGAPYREVNPACGLHTPEQPF